jgi:NADPH:quinone reductase-like Zn-dependent oxidoreductase
MCVSNHLSNAPMRAVGFYQNLPIDHADALHEIEVATPELRDHDVLVEVKAVSVKPVDTKIRAHGDVSSGTARVLGWDAAGIVQATGRLATLFKPGNRVWLPVTSRGLAATANGTRSTSASWT